MSESDAWCSGGPRVINSRDSAGYFSHWMYPRRHLSFMAEEKESIHNILATEL